MDRQITPNNIGKYYDEWTDRYRSSFGDTFQAFRTSDPADLHRYILEKSGISDGERILDAGCGICGPSVYFATHRDVNIDAITVSPYQATIARELVAASSLDHKVHVQVADFHRLTEYFPREVFDRVVFLESFCHSSNADTVLQGVFQVLKPGGTIFIKDFFEKQCASPADQALVRAVVDRVAAAFLCNTPNLQETLGRLKRVGFCESAVEPVRFVHDHSVWSDFNESNGFDLYGDKAPYEWSDWMTLRFEKRRV
jgi:cyclopropane fatty-acyl-phospholipid synthase-like methyltransferase